ncbi:DUF1338 domain-containing protein [Maribacter sp. SA7]|uniref:DUF1338 domain-containing protein n=1 Tax=Maribacter zhoushanensis TaxID=3030012 RepID=UPI0023ED1BD5|nr:DUF1338 domain-containing protein [Maribacter zhoushanensis]MDF4202895.1 DUF1338 domain-containing protein [Maribacter zhoushanensis]
MNFEQNTALDKVLTALFLPYKKSVTDVEKITNAMIGANMIANENEIVNDHIAFRTLGVPNLGIASFEKIFLHYGYTKMDSYHFAAKKLDAYWYAPPSPEYPRIFISELRVQDLSSQAQRIISEYTNPINTDPIDNIDLDNTKAVGDFFYKPLWKLPSLADFQQLSEESEYAAWVIYNRYYLNHYTISVHDLPSPYNSLEVFNEFLEELGIVLNSSGGIIKTSKDGLLRQSSSVAEMVDATFAHNENMKISGSYVEFAERSVLPEFESLDKNEIQREHRREGFEAANADKIFESTYLEQTLKK